MIVDLPRLSGDAPVEVPAAEQAVAVSPVELLQRPEIRQAMQGQAATTIRRVASGRQPPGALRRGACPLA